MAPVLCGVVQVETGWWLQDLAGNLCNILTVNYLAVARSYLATKNFESFLFCVF